MQAVRHDASYVASAEAFGVRVALAVDSAALYQRARRAIGARDEALAVVSHDLRNPLSAIGLCVNALRESPPPSADVMNDLLGTVAESATLMKRIIQDLLDVASIDAGRLSLERRRQALPPVLDLAYGMFREAAADAGVALELDRQGFDRLPEANIDAERILQVLANLLNNALKFTDAGGSVTVSAVPRAWPDHRDSQGHRCRYRARGSAQCLRPVLARPAQRPDSLDRTRARDRARYRRGARRPDPGGERARTRQHVLD